jgi:arginine repressor
MAKKKTARNSEENKSQAIREALARNPKILPKDLVEELKSQGIEVTPAYVSNIKTSLKKGKKKRATARKGARASSNSGAAPTKVDVSDLVKAKSLADQVGGLEKAQELLTALKKLK